jgi:hypothetical protein
MNRQKNEAWFPAKRYGFGWGFPNCWQGRVVMAAWLLLFIGGIIVLRPDRYPIAYAACELLVTALLVLVIVAKGEKPRWRWGDDSDLKPGI